MRLIVPLRSPPPFTAPHPSHDHGDARRPVELLVDVAKDFGAKDLCVLAVNVYLNQSLTPKLYSDAAVSHPFGTQKFIDTVSGDLSSCAFGRDLEAMVQSLTVDWRHKGSDHAWNHDGVDSSSSDIF